MGTFSYIIMGKLFLSCGQPFGTDFCPVNWEVACLVLKQLATILITDISLCDKHRQYLDGLQWDHSLGKRQHVAFTGAVRDPQHAPPWTSMGSILSTPHFIYMDDVYIDFNNVVHVEQAIAVIIKAIFIILRPSQLHKQQDPISVYKLEDKIIGPVNKRLGHVISTHCLTLYTLDPISAPFQFWHWSSSSGTGTPTFPN